MDLGGTVGERGAVFPAHPVPAPEVWADGATELGVALRVGTIEVVVVVVGVPVTVTVTVRVTVAPAEGCGDVVAVGVGDAGGVAVGSPVGAVREG
jgi:hypothetical protein